jgi:PKD repeat protein
VATLITNDWLQTAGSMPHALIYAAGYLWIGCETEPGSLIRMDPGSPGTFSTITFPADSKHFWLMDLIYIAAKGKVYAVFGKFGTDFYHEATVAEIDPVTLAWTDVIEDFSYNPEQGSLTADATYLYVVSRTTGFLHRYLLSTWAAAGSLDLNLACNLPHCVRYDSVTGKIYCTGTSGLLPFPNLACRIDPVAFTVEQAAGYPGESVFTDDFAMDATYLWCGSETTGNVVRIKKSDLSGTEIPLPVGRSVYSVYNDGSSIWVAFKGGPPGMLAQIDPATLLYTMYQFPVASQVSPNEIWGDVEVEGSAATKLFFTGFTSPGWVSQYTLGGTPPAPTVVDFTATPASILVGATSTLSWTVSGAITSVSIDHGIGTVGDTGSTVVTPAVTTTYTLTATGPGGTSTATVTVTVSAPPPPAPTVVSFAAAPASILPGATSTLSWTVSGAITSVSIDHGIGTVGDTGSTVVTPAVTTTYTLTATGPGGTSTATVTVTVPATPAAPSSGAAGSAATPSSSLSPLPKFWAQAPSPQNAGDWQSFMRWLVSMWRKTAGSIDGPQSISLNPPDSTGNAQQAQETLGAAAVFQTAAPVPKQAPDDLTSLVQYALARPPYPPRPGGGYVLVGTQAQMQALDPTAYWQCEFYQTDTTWTYVSDGLHWHWIAGEYWRAQSQVAAVAATLGASDVAALVRISDYGHVLRWGGAGWNYFDAGDVPGRISGFLVDPSPATGWHLCDGTAAVPFLRSDGTLGTQDLPNLVSTPAYLKFGAAATGINAPVAPLFTGSADTTGNDSGSVAVASASGPFTNVPEHPHTHSVTPTGTIGTTGEPQNLILRPWFRQ